MSSFGFGVFVFVAFVLPIPLLVWVDRPRRNSERDT